MAAPRIVFASRQGILDDWKSVQRMARGGCAMNDIFMERSARFSPCRNYRYELWRTWDSARPYAMFIGLNPSTADETQDDPTIRRCIRFAHDWGYGALCMGNLFALRATDPRVMLAHHEPVGPDNGATLQRLAAGAGIVVAAWGAHGTHRGRHAWALACLPNLHHLGLTASGQPRHPLYLPASTMPRAMALEVMR